MPDEKKASNDDKQIVNVPSKEPQCNKSCTYFFQLRKSEQAARPDGGRQDQLAQREVLCWRAARGATAVTCQSQGREGRLGRDPRQGLEVRLRGEVLLRPVPAFAKRESRSWTSSQCRWWAQAKGSTAVWPNGYIIFSKFGHSEQWKLPITIKYLPQ